MSEPLPFLHKNAQQSPGFVLWQVTATWQRQIATALKPHQLTQFQFVLLAGIFWLSQEEKWITQIMLAKHARVDVMTTSQVLRTLETKGYIKRKTHPHDVRAHCLHLTENGKKKVQSTTPEVEAIDKKFFSKLGSKKSSLLFQLRSLLD